MKTIIAYQPNWSGACAEIVGGNFGIPMAFKDGYQYHIFIPEADIVAKWVIKLKSDA